MKHNTNVQKCREMIINGTVLSIDPGSHYCGFALFAAGDQIDSGVKEMNHRAPIAERLHDLSITLRYMTASQPPDVLVIEYLRGRMMNEYLKWAVGLVVGTVPARELCEIPVAVWKRHARQMNYHKSDKQDAIAIGETAIRLARGEVV